MSIIDQKINHLHYLYQKRIQHNIEIETAISDINNQIKEKENQSEQAKSPYVKRKNNMKFYFLVGGGLLGYASGRLVFSLLIRFFKTLVLSQFALAFASIIATACTVAAAVIPFILSFKLLKHNKKYCNLNKEILEVSSTYQKQEELQRLKQKLQRLESHFTTSKRELERLACLLEECERKQKRLNEIIDNQVLEQMKEKSWSNYAVSMENIQRSDDLQESKKEKQKIRK